MRAAAAVVLFALGASGGARAVSGSVSGCMVYDDRREQCCNSQTGCHHTSCNTNNQPFREAKVALVAWWGEVASGSTNSNGCYSFNWSDASCLGPTCTYTLRIYMENVNDFIVKNTWGATYSGSTTVTISAGNTALGTFEPADPTAERWGLYATTQQFFDRVVDQSSLLSATMTDIEVVYPDSKTAAHEDFRARIMSGDARLRPFGVAHELGHLVNRHAFGEPYTDYYGCTTDHDTYEIHECERVAFEEGLASFWSVPWGWSNNATDPIADNVHYETSQMEGYCEGDRNCDVQACVTSFLWDIFDDPANDDDPIDDADPTIAVAEMAAILQQYTDNCSGAANRCSNEPDPDGRNHWDFLENFVDVYPGLEASARTILDVLGMDGVTGALACEEPY